MRLAFWIALAAFLIDQASKYVILHLLKLDTVRLIEVFPPFLTFRMAWNRGINFGILQDTGPWLLIAIALGIVAWVTIWVLKGERRPILQVAAGLVIGGALGNVIDRLIYGAVADFLNMSCCGIENPFSFNVADVAIFAGAFGLVLFSGKDKTP